jgi:acetyl-CoA synthetase
MKGVEDLEALGLDRKAAAVLWARVSELLEKHDPVTCWRILCDSVLGTHIPFPVHRRIHEHVFANWIENRGPRPVWAPTQAEIESTNLFSVMSELGFKDFGQLHRWSVDDPEAFWRVAIERMNIRFHKRPDSMLDARGGVRSPRWLPGGRMNIVDSCFGADPQSTAVICGSASGRLVRWTYGQLRALANRVAHGLDAAGFRAGDALAVDMPMTFEAVAIYLGIVQSECVVVSIADSFAAPQIRTRLQMADARAIFTTDHVVRAGKRLAMYEKVVEAGAPHAVVLDGPEGRRAPLRAGDMAWDQFLGTNEVYEPRAASPGDDINILFSSGTTGEPKAIPWHHTTAIRAAADGHLHHDIQPGHVVAWPTNLGWMMGPWLIFASLINRATIALFDDVPTGRPFGSFVQDAGVTMLGVVPSIVRAWRETNCMDGLDFSRIRAFSSTGECSSQEDMFYLMHLAGYRPVIEYCGGTEIGGGYITGTLVQPAVPATFTTAALGIDFRILNEQGSAADTGELFLVPPSMGLSTRLLNRDHDEVYFEGCPEGPDGETLRRHGDHFTRLGGGFFRALGRVDDTMNLGGIKASSAEIERALQGVAAVKETAAIACPPPGGGPDRLVIYAVLALGVGGSGAELRALMQKALSSGLNPLFKIHEVVVIDALPRTASQKVMRRQLRARYEEG